MAIGMIGAGRVATHLAKALQGIAPVQLILSRRLDQAEQLAQIAGCSAASELAQLKTCQVLWLCVPDDQIGVMAQQLAQLGYDGLVIHTSGSTPLDILTRCGLRGGVFYPLQTFSPDQVINWSNVPLLLEAQQTADLAVLHQWAALLSRQIYHYDSRQRASLHLGAVFACNFANYCIDIGQQIVLEHNVDAQLLQPLLEGTFKKLQHQSAYTSQTGPAARRDLNTLEHQKRSLHDHPDWQQLYQLMSQGIMQRHPS